MAETMSPRWPDQNLHSIMGVSEEAFSAVESGQKTLEIQLGANNFSHIKPGTVLEFMTLGAKKPMIKVRVLGTRKYQTLEDLMAAEDMAKIAPGKSKEEIEQYFQKIFTSESKDIQKHGLVVINFEKI